MSFLLSTFWNGLVYRRGNEKSKDLFFWQNGENDMKYINIHAVLGIVRVDGCFVHVCVDVYACVYL